MHDCPSELNAGVKNKMRQRYRGRRGRWGKVLPAGVTLMQSLKKVTGHAKWSGLNAKPLQEEHAWYKQGTEGSGGQSGWNSEGMWGGDGGEGRSVWDRDL